MMSLVREMLRGMGSKLTHFVRLRLVLREAPRQVIRQSVRVIERAGVQPDAPRAQSPGVPHGAGEQVLAEAAPDRVAHDSEIRDLDGVVVGDAAQLVPAEQAAVADRKSTRLNSSHSQISYAVFCLKKKKKRGARST